LQNFFFLHLKIGIPDALPHSSRIYLVMQCTFFLKKVLLTSVDSRSYILILLLNLHILFVVIRS
jgi:hypothetical protein